MTPPSVLPEYSMAHHPGGCLTQRMGISLSVPRGEDLPHVADVLATWQHDDGPLQLHPGDLGWFSMRGPERTAASLRTWSRAGTMLALGLLDGPDLLRMALAPGAAGDEELARRLAEDISDPSRGVLEAGRAVVEARGATLLTRLLVERGWEYDEPWTPLRHDLTSPVAEDLVTRAGVRIETVGPATVAPWAEVHWSAFRGTPFGDTERADVVDWWLTMQAGPLGARGRSLTAVDPHGDAVAVAAVWSAGPGRPGLVEPMGVHRDHQGRGRGAAITVAAAAALREMGASSAVVCAESSNVAAIATYTAAGFAPRDEVADLKRA